tara:strand:+ start:12902 stop:13744 length:843 start_codon:yes stop_codon:yes gene_type:complete
MTRGVLLFATNNTSINYVKQAHFLATRIRKFMGLPTSIVTSTDIEKQYPEWANDFDHIEYSNLMFHNATRKRYADGDLSDKIMPFYNKNRSYAYDVTPYSETLVMDTDFVICNDILNNCFEQQKDVMLYKDANHVGIWRNTPEFERISDTSIDFYWATVFFFRKTNVTKIFFDLIKHIEQNYMHYRNMYQFKTTTFRNDFAFSIAVHIMNGYQRGNFAGLLPGKKFYAIDKDVVLDIVNDEIKLLVQKEKRLGEYTGVNLKGSNCHVMNKFSLERVIDNQ